MRWSVESWDPAYGLPGEALDLDDTSADVVVDIEVAAAGWAPLDVPPPGAPPGGNGVVFVDGVRRVDARAWVHGPDGSLAPALCATYGAGAVQCLPGVPGPAGEAPTGASARIAAVLIERGLFTASPQAVDVHTRARDYAVPALRSTPTEALPPAPPAPMAGPQIAAAAAGCGRGGRPP